jgi:phasin
MPEHPARNFAQKATSDTIDTLERSKATVQEASKIMEQSCVNASKGAVDFNLKLMDIAQDNVNAAFDFARQLSHVKSPSAVLELSAEHARKQFQNLTAQAQELTGLTQKAMTEAAQSLQTGVARAAKLDDRSN